MLRRALVVAASLALAACGGGDSSGPNNPFPLAAGVYQVDGGFDALSRQSASITGAITLVQASQQAGSLTGSAALTGQINGTIYNLPADHLDNASVSPAGVVTFTIPNSAGTTIWNFSGTLSGNIITGRHTLSDGTTSSSGDWTGNRASAFVAGAAQAPGGGLSEFAHRILR